MQLWRNYYSFFLNIYPLCCYCPPLLFATATGQFIVPSITSSGYQYLQFFLFFYPINVQTAVRLFFPLVVTLQIFLPIKSICSFQTSHYAVSTTVAVFVIPSNSSIQTSFYPLNVGQAATLQESNK